MPYQVSNFFAVGWTQNDRIQKYPLTLIFLYSFTLIYSFFPYYHSIISPFSFNILSSESTFSACPVALTLSHTLDNFSFWIYKKCCSGHAYYFFTPEMFWMQDIVCSVNIFLLVGEQLYF